MTFGETSHQPSPHLCRWRRRGRKGEPSAQGHSSSLGQLEPGARSPDCRPIPPTSLQEGWTERPGAGYFHPSPRFQRPLPRPGANQADGLGRSGCSRSAARSSMARKPGGPGGKPEPWGGGGTAAAASGGWKPNVSRRQRGRGLRGPGGAWSAGGGSRETGAGHTSTGGGKCVAGRGASG